MLARRSMTRLRPVWGGQTSIGPLKGDTVMVLPRGIMGRLSVKPPSIHVWERTHTHTHTHTHTALRQPITERGTDTTSQSENGADTTSQSQRMAQILPANHKDWQSYSSDQGKILCQSDQGVTAHKGYPTNERRACTDWLSQSGVFTNERGACSD